MRTLNYVGRGWWSHGAARFKWADDAIKVYGKDNVSQIGPGVWLCTKDDTPVELLIMEREQNPKAKTKVKTKVKSTEKAGTRGVKMAYSTDSKSGGGRERAPADPSQRKPPRAIR